jgi:methionyl-tRNA synthetase
VIFGLFNYRQRIREIPIYFLSGSDEHGQKMAQSAEERGITPKQFCDIMQAKFVEFFNKGNIHPNRMIRTTEGIYFFEY